ncbi:MAG: OB-fold nucleic acid binding domain-containing protein, partial [Chloroflexota bacterium]|nr:OB-fold nucleic acid binding domain-containing protein [Chloroflexota bacterium]
MELSDLQEVRRQKAVALRAAGADPYPGRAHRTHTTRTARDRFAAIEPSLADEGHDAEPVTIAGRIVSRRHQGKTIFAHLRDGAGELQLYIRRDVVGDEAFERFLKLFDLGDFVQAAGTLFRTRMGEISLRVTTVTM